MFPTEMIGDFLRQSLADTGQCTQNHASHRLSRAFEDIAHHALIGRKLMGFVAPFKTVEAPVPLRRVDLDLLSHGRPQPPRHR